MKIDYEYEVLEILNDAGGDRGAMVRYVPGDESFSTFEVFVAVPWHKCTDADHAREVLESKIAARAPMNQWQKEVAATAATPDNSEAITSELGKQKHTGRKSAGETESKRRAGTARVSRPGDAAG